MNKLWSIGQIIVSTVLVIPAVHSPSGDAVIRGKAGASEIVITTRARVSGAIHSLTWGGKEFVDSYDHGRQIQSASNFDCGGDFIPEVFNPTEAGSSADGTGDKSSSKLLRLHSSGSELRTTTQMAFWLAPGEKSQGNPARNEKVLSDHQISKRVRIGVEGLPHAIEYEVEFDVPRDEGHIYAQFEALTGYMPPEFSRFWTFEPASGELKALDDGPGEQPMPVVFATPSGSHAMGIYSPKDSPGYGRFRFKDEKVNKWNCVYRIRNRKGIVPGRYVYQMYVAVGTRDDVTKTLRSLANR